MMRGRTWVLSLLALAVIATGCGKSLVPTPAGVVPTGPPPVATPSAGLIPANPTEVPTQSAADQQAEADDLAQAQQDIAALEQELAQADAGINQDPSTEGDVNP